MRKMIMEYSKSCCKLNKRIKELTKERHEYELNGATDKVKELDLDRRIQLLYTEQRQTKEVMLYLLSYVRSVEERGEKTKFM